MPYNVDIPGYMSVGDLLVIESLARKVPKRGIIVEIGSFMGRSSWTFAKSAHSSVKVYCIDRWESFEIDPHRQNIMANFHAGKIYDFQAFKNFVNDCPNIIPIQSFSTEVKWPKNKQADVIFIDASHKSPDVDEDLAYWFPYLKKHGILCGHDFDVFVFPDVCRAVMNFSEYVKRPITFFKNSTIWAIDFSQKATLGLKSTSFIMQKINELLSPDQSNSS